MNIILPTDRVRDFLDKSKLIGSGETGVMSILKTIKLEIVFGIATFTKANNLAYCKYSFPVDCEDLGEAILMEESNLKLFCATSTKTMMMIISDGDKIILTDKTYKIKLNPTGYKAEEYPSHPSEKVFPYRISQDVIGCIKIAKFHISNDNLRPTFCVVHISSDAVFSANGELIYTKKIETKLPNIGLSGSECDIISSMPYVDYAENSSYNIFKNDNVVYGFRKTEGAQPFDHNSFINNVKRTSYLSIKKEDVLNFCQSTIDFANKDSFVVADLSVEDESATLTFFDRERNEENELIADCEVVGEGFDLKFKPVVWRGLLKSIPYDNLLVSEEDTCIAFFTNEDKSFLGMIAKFA